jgi:hypothetical protein
MIRYRKVHITKYTNLMFTLDISRVDQLVAAWSQKTEKPQTSWRAIATREATATPLWDVLSPNLSALSHADVEISVL